MFEKEEFLNECHRVLKNDGQMLFTVSFPARYHHTPFDYWRFTEHSLDRIMNENNMVIKKIYAAGGKYLTLVDAIEALNINNRVLKKLRSICLSYFTSYAIKMDKKNVSDLSRARNYLVIAEKK